jgi:hypothetical protein
MVDYFIPESFKLNGYKRLLQSFFSQGYEVRDFCDDDGQLAKLDRQHLILRHDIDMSLDAALAIGAIEMELGVSSTYFVLLGSEMYNIFSPSSKYILESLMKMGHKIGLHFDASQYENNFSSLDKAAQQECTLLENLIESSIKIISFHRPSQRFLGLDSKLAGRIHTYQPYFFKDMGYCSDSRGAWYHGNPLQNNSVKNKSALQLLTHPIWWQDNGGKNVQDALDDFCWNRIDILRNELANNCQTYKYFGSPTKFF